MQDIRAQYTQDYLEAINKYIRETVAKSCQKLSQAEAIVLDEFKTIISSANSVHNCRMAIKAKGLNLPKEVQTIFHLLETEADKLYLDEGFSSDKDIRETKSVHLKQLQKKLYETIDFFLIRKTVNKNRPIHICELRDIVIAFETLSEHERIQKLMDYLPKLNGPLGRSRLKTYVMDAVYDVRKRCQADLLNNNEMLHFENEAYKTQVIALKNLLLYERKKHAENLADEKKKHAGELSKVHQCLNSRENEIHRLKHKISVQEKRIDKQQIEIDALRLQMRTMITLMEEFKQFIPKSQCGFAQNPVPTNTVNYSR